MIPTACTEAGYRLYDDKALETLQQVLFFREFDMPLKEIKSIMENPNLDRSGILLSQRQMLVQKKEHLDQLIANISDILKGDNSMNFEVFTKKEIGEIYEGVVNNMTPGQQAVIEQNYGSMQHYREQFVENAASERVQKNFQKVVEWYGGKNSALEAAKNQDNPQVVPMYQKRIQEIQKKLAEKKGMDVTSLEIREIVGEYDFVSKQLYQMKDVASFMLELAEGYQTNKELQEILDVIYGDGTTAYIGEAIQAFYKK